MDPGSLVIPVVLLSVLVLVLLVAVFRAFSLLLALREQVAELRAGLRAAEPEPRLAAATSAPAHAPHPAHRRSSSHPPSSAVRHLRGSRPEPGVEMVEIVVHGRSASLAAIRADVPGISTYPTTIAGESLHATELERARAFRGSATQPESLVDAILMREPANPHDANAVAVYLAGFGQVGHLPEAAARAWSPLLLEYEQKAKAVLVTRAAIRGLDTPGVWLRTDLETARNELERHLARELQPA